MTTETSARSLKQVGAEGRKKQRKGKTKDVMEEEKARRRKSKERRRIVWSNVLPMQVHYPSLVFFPLPFDSFRASTARGPRLLVLAHLQMEVLNERHRAGIDLSPSS